MREPLHRQVTRRLQDMISSDAYRVDDRLPSEPELARQLGVSRATLREALDRLEGSGVINRLHGVGTFISSKTPSITVSITIPLSLTALISSLGMIPGVEAMTVTEEPVFPDDVERLDIPAGGRVFRIERVRTANGQPAAYTIDTVPAWVMKHYPARKGDENFSLIDHLREFCGVRFIRSEADLMPVHNIRSVAEKLGFDASAHIFFLEDIGRAETGAPVILSKEYLAPWIFRFQVGRSVD